MAKLNKKVQSTKTAYSSWLNSYKWTHFVTLTTPYTLTLKSGRRLVERFFYKLKEHEFEPSIFWVAERYEVKDGYHLHALLRINKKNLKKHELTFICELYQICAGTSKVGLVDGNIKYLNWSRLEFQKYIKGGGGGAYVTKYVTKENNSSSLKTIFICK